MNQDEQRIAIAEACGWRKYEPTPESISRGYPKWGYWINPKFSFREPLEVPPDYLNDLNAMFKAEEVILEVLRWEYAFNLLKLVATYRPFRDGNQCDLDYFQAAHATADQRAEAFLKTLNLWKE